MKYISNFYVFAIVVLFSILGGQTSFAADTTPPTTPTQLIATPVSSSQVNLTWMASSDSVGVTGYDVYQNGTQIGTTANTSYYVSNLTASTTYSFTVAAYDAAGNTSPQSVTASATTTSLLPPTAPTLSLTVISPTQVSLSWTTSTSSVGVAGYYVYENSNKIGTTSNTYYSINGLSLATTYNFAVAAYDTLGNVSDQSTIISTTTPSPTTPTVVLPTTPTNLETSPVSSSQIDLTWTASTDSAGIAGYDLYENGNQITTTPNTFYAVTGLTAGTSYTFTVAAYDAAGNTSSQSVSATATTASATSMTTPTSPVSIVIPTTTIPAATPVPAPATTTKTNFKFTLLIKKGSSGNEVLKLQQFLNTAGYNCGTPDGKFGSKTKTALINFQLANNLTGDGIVGAMTRVVLNKS